MGASVRGPCTPCVSARSAPVARARVWDHPRVTRGAPWTHGLRSRRGIAAALAFGLGLVVATTTAADARPVTGLVFADDNGDGLPSAGEPGVANAVVAVGVRAFVVTDARGQFQLDVTDAERPAGGIAWVRVPDGFTPGPVWARLDGKDHIDLALRPLPAPLHGPLTFVVTADTHLSYAHEFWADLGDVMLDAVAAAPAPAFTTILGDITQNNFPAQFALVDAALANLGVPYIPVPGNHDWYDGGQAWFAHYGPDNYSFDIDQVHFVVWNMAMSEADITRYLGAELAHVGPEMTVVAMTHGPPSPAVVRRLRELGVDYLLTGHTHTNRIVDHDGLVELNTEPLLMGGLDFTPAGYRLVTLDHGELTAEHRTTIDRPVLALASPAPGQCTPPEGGPLVVSAGLDAGASSVTARIDCATPVTLAPAGGWSYGGTLPPLPAGPHTLSLEAIGRGGARVTRAVGFEVCATAPARVTEGSWPQLGGGAAHTGATQHELAPPLVTRWTASVGGHVLHGAPAIAHGMIFVTTTDLAAGSTGGVVALDLATGVIRWRTPVPQPIRGGATVVGDVVAAVQVDGTVIGLDTLTGAVRWRYELGLGVEPRGAETFGTPVADEGDLVIGNQRRLATLSAETGRPLWLRAPAPAPSEFPSLAAIAVDEDVAVGVFDRELGGVLAWERLTGELLWQLTDDRALSINASPVISGGMVYLSNGATEVIALELATGIARWKVKLDPMGYDWAIATIGTPAISRGVLVVPTLARDLVGLDAASGRVLWRRTAAGGAVVRTSHYRGSAERGFAASPVITGDVVWAADTGGHLVALELHSGAVLWRAALEVPALAGLSTTGAALVVATFDGTVRLLAPTDRARAPISPASCALPAPAGGCCDAAPGDAARSSALVVLGLAVVGYRRRRRRSTSTARPIGNAAPAAAPGVPPALHV